MDNAILKSFLTEQSLKDLLDTAHDLIQIVDTDGTVLYVNRSWATLLEYDFNEIRERSIYSFICEEEDRSLFKSYRDDIINGRLKNKEIVIRLKTKNGKTIYLEGFSSVRKKNSKALYTLGIFRDITAKVESERELKEREHNLHQLLSNAPDAIIVISPESHIIFWNPAAEKLFGWSNDEVINQPLSGIIIPEQHREGHYNGMKRFLSTGESHLLNKTVEITALNKSGEEFFISLTISTTTLNGSLAFISFIRDIREQKKNEAELEKKRQQLEVSNRQLEQFAHVASHDMKEPIRKIRMFGEGLQSSIFDELSPKSKEYLSKMMNSAQRLQNLVDGVLNYATANSINEAFHLVDLNTVLSNIETDLELIIEQKKAVIGYDKLPKIQGIAFLIYQLFYNLLYNALKFSTDTAHPVIEITAKVLDESVVETNRRFIKIKVKDNGIGFKQQYASQIFDTFTRLNSRSKYEGTGLGLALCKRIMDRHEGFITAEGEEGKGATFIMLFPD